MNFLELAQRTHLLLRVGEGAPGTEPTTVTGQVGVLNEIVEYVRASHDDICRLHTDWEFMRARGTLPLPMDGRVLTRSALNVVLPDMHKVVPLTRTNDDAYILMAPDSDLARVNPVFFVPRTRWHGIYDRAPIPTGMPGRFTISKGGLEFDAVADQDYTLMVEYRLKIVPLADDDDEPMFDDEYHSTIVSWAIVNYYCASRDGTAELLAKHTAILRRELTKLRNEQLPDFLIA